MSKPPFAGSSPAGACRGIAGLTDALQDGARAGAAPNGKFLYGTNRGHDSIAAYRIGEDGRLTLLGIEPSLGKGPQNLLITGNGELLLCANMPGNNLAVFRIDAATGGLKSVGEPLAVPSPSCLRLLP